MMDRHVTLQLLWICVTISATLQIGKSLVRSQLVSLEYFVDIKSFRSHCGPGIDSASNRNEYQEHFLGGKGGRCLRQTTLPVSCAVVMKSGNLNFLEPSGPLQACNGTVSLCNHYIKKSNKKLHFFHHFGLHSWNDKKNICWPR